MRLKRQACQTPPRAAPKLLPYDWRVGDDSGNAIGHADHEHEN